MATQPQPAVRFIQLDATTVEAEAAAELAQGLRAPQAVVSPKYLYDNLGSAIFCAITELPEYYPTRTEAAIFGRHRAEIAAAVHDRLGPRPTMIDLGAGDGAKAAGFFDALQPRRYVAIDISADFMRGALEALARRFASIEMVGVGMDFSRRLALPEGAADARSLVFYPGSSIGNFAPDDALRLLREAREVSSGGALLIGADLHKPHAVLEAAYDDAIGVTAAFNLNLLRHLNRRIGANFDVRQWRHVALFNSEQSRIEMHLEARTELQLRWPGGERSFAAGERIHTENSYKWTPESFESLLRDAGWRHVRRWTDDDRWFGVFLASA